MRRRNSRTADELRELELVRRSDAAIVRALRKSWKESDRAGAQAARGEISWEQADALRAKADRNYQRRRQAIIDALPADLRAEIEEATGGPLRNPGLRDYLSAGRGAAREVGSSLAQAPSELVGEAQRGLGKLQAGLKEFGSRARAAAEREEAKRKCDEPTPEQALKVLARALGVKGNPRRKSDGDWGGHPAPRFKVGDRVSDWDGERVGTVSHIGSYQGATFGGWNYKVQEDGGPNVFRSEANLRRVKHKRGGAKRNPLGAHGYRRNLGDGPPPPPPLPVRANRRYRRNMGEGSFPAPLDRTPRGHYRRNPAGPAELRALKVGDSLRLVTASSSAEGYGPYTVGARRSGEVDLRHPQGYRHNLVEDVKGLALVTGHGAERVLDVRVTPASRSNPASDHETGRLVIDTEVPNGRVRVYDPRPKNKWYNFYVTRPDGTEARYALHETTMLRDAYWGSNGRAPKWVLTAAANAGFDWRSV